MFHYNINLIKNATNKFKKVFYFSKVKSTNEMAKKLIQKSKLNGNAVIISNNKMEAEKSFDFPHKNTNVHMTVVIKNINLDLKLLSIILPLAVANAIDKISGLKTNIRWPNYILIDEKMVSKIKVEHFEGNSRENFKYTIVEISIKVNGVNKPNSKLKYISTSLEEKCKNHINRTHLVCCILKEIDKLLEMSPLYLTYKYMHKINPGLCVDE